MTVIGFLMLLSIDHVESRSGIINIFPVITRLIIDLPYVSWHRAACHYFELVVRQTLLEICGVLRGSFLVFGDSHGVLRI